TPFWEAAVITASQCRVTLSLPVLACSAGVATSAAPVAAKPRPLSYSSVKGVMPMRPQWTPCTAVLTIEGRGPVRCWQPPRPGGDGRCVAHEDLDDPVFAAEPRAAAGSVEVAGPSEVRHRADSIGRTKV